MGNLASTEVQSLNSFNQTIQQSCTPSQGVSQTNKDINIQYAVEIGCPTTISNYAHQDAQCVIKATQASLLKQTTDLTTQQLLTAAPGFNAASSSVSYANYINQQTQSLCSSKQELPQMNKNFNLKAGVCLFSPINISNSSDQTSSCTLLGSQNTTADISTTVSTKQKADIFAGLSELFMPIAIAIVVIMMAYFFFRFGKGRKKAQPQPPFMYYQPPMARGNPLPIEQSAPLIEDLGEGAAPLMIAA